MNQTLSKHLNAQNCHLHAWTLLKKKRQPFTCVKCVENWKHFTETCSVPIFSAKYGINFYFKVFFSQRIYMKEGMQNKEPLKSSCYLDASSFSNVTCIVFLIFSCSLFFHIWRFPALEMLFQNVKKGMMLPISYLFVGRNKFE